MPDTQHFDIEKITAYFRNNFCGRGHLDIKGGGNGKYLIVAILPQEHSFEFANQNTLGYFKFHVSRKGEELSLSVRKPIPVSNEKVIPKGRYKVRVSSRKGKRHFIRRFWPISEDILEALPSSSLFKGDLSDYCFENKVA